MEYVGYMSRELMERKRQEKAEVAAQHKASLELLQFCLGYMYAGQDVCLTFRTSVHRGFAGYWVWNLTDLIHTQCSSPELYAQFAGNKQAIHTAHAEGRAAWKEYRKGVVHRGWRWPDVLRLAEKIRAGRMVAR